MRYVPPSKRPGRPESALARSRRLMLTEEARGREQDRPFEPEAARESYAQPHHFAVNDRLPPTQFMDRLPGTLRFMVVTFDEDGERVLASPMSHAFMSVHEAGTWAAQKLAEGTPFEILRYTKGSPQDPNMQDRFEQNAGPRGAVDEQAATELVLYIENTSELSLDGPRGQGRSVLLNALRKWRKGTYDEEKAVKLFEYLAEAGAKQYAQEMGNKRTWATMFNVPTRTAAARQLEESFRSGAEQGEYDHVDTRPGQ